MTKAIDLTYRVLKLPHQLRQDMRKKRDAEGITNEQFVATAVASYLPALQNSLHDLGFGAHRGKFSNARLPFSEKAKTLDHLRRVSNEVSVPISQLLSICIDSATATTKPKKRGKRRGRPKKQAKSSS